MSFADTFLVEDLQPLRQHLLYHPLWVGIEQGTVTHEQLQRFALQDWWLVRQAYRLDALAIASATDLEAQELLIAKLQSKVGCHQTLLRFGTAFGLSQGDFDSVEPLAGCMALTNFFYWMLVYGSPAEKLAAVSASEDIFIEICKRVAPSLMDNYSLNVEDVAFFTVHEEIGKRVTPVDEVLLPRYQSLGERRLITRAIRLSYEFELMFYDTVMIPPSIP
jgi:pyrroloquinoline-quinone synthase